MYVENTHLGVSMIGVVKYLYRNEWCSVTGIAYKLLQYISIITLLLLLVLYLCSTVFQEKPEIPPTLAQVQARSIPPEEYSYMASILRLLRNLPFMLLVISYGGSYSLSNHTRVYRHVCTPII